MSIRPGIPLLCLIAAPAAEAAAHAQAAGHAAPRPAAHPAAKPAAFDPHAMVTRPSMRADRFGCMLQRRFGHRDPTFDSDLEGFEHPGAGDVGCR